MLLNIYYLLGGGLLHNLIIAKDWEAGLMFIVWAWLLVLYYAVTTKTI